MITAMEEPIKKGSRPEEQMQHRNYEGAWQPSSQHPGSSSLLVIQGHGSKIATSESRVTHSKILINQWRKRVSSRDQLGH
jgi:hypothetical protein